MTTHRLLFQGNNFNILESLAFAESDQSVVLELTDAIEINTEYMEACCPRLWVTMKRETLKEICRAYGLLTSEGPAPVKTKAKKKVKKNGPVRKRKG